MRFVTIDEDIYTYVQRPFVRAFVRRLTPTAVTPNQITLLRALLGIASGVLLATGTPPFLVLSALCLVLSRPGDRGNGFRPRRSGRGLPSACHFVLPVRAADRATALYRRDADMDGGRRPSTARRRRHPIAGQPALVSMLPPA